MILCHDDFVGFMPFLGGPSAIRCYQTHISGKAWCKMSPTNFFGAMLYSVLVHTCATFLAYALCKYHVLARKKQEPVSMDWFTGKIETRNHRFSLDFPVDP